jgi:hypothetical protein
LAEEKADEMLLLQATLAALYGYVGNPAGVEAALAFLGSKGVDRTEAEEVGKINFKGLQESTYDGSTATATAFPAWLRGCDTISVSIVPTSHRLTWRVCTVA